MTSTAYPQRPSYFAHKFCRLLTKAAVANEIGPEACWLLTVIAHQEDAKRYRGPVTFYNGQLAALCGCSEDRLDRLRTKAKDAGWIHYEPGRKGIPGRYWCLTPSAYSGLPDGPMDEDFPAIDGGNSGSNGEPTELSSAIQGGKSRGKCGDNHRESADPSTLCPNPVPIPERYMSPDGDQSASDDADLEEVVSEWNKLGPPFSKCELLSEKRRRILRSRLADSYWCDNWREALAKIPQTPFLRGETSNWKASFDFFIKPDSVLSIMEGKYDSGKTAKGSRNDHSKRTSSAYSYPTTGTGDDI